MNRELKKQAASADSVAAAWVWAAEMVINNVFCVFFFFQAEDGIRDISV